MGSEEAGLLVCLRRCLALTRSSIQQLNAHPETCSPFLFYHLPPPPNSRTHVNQMSNDQSLFRKCRNNSPNETAQMAFERLIKPLYTEKGRKITFYSNFGVGFVNSFKNVFLNQLVSVTLVARFFLIKAHILIPRLEINLICLPN